MSRTLDILLVSRQKDTLDRLEQLLRAAEFAPRRQLNSNGHVDPLHGLDKLPDLVVLHLSHLWREELEALAARKPERRPALIVVGTAIDMNVMRMAMQAGARDLLQLATVHSDLLEAVRRAQSEQRSPPHSTHGTTSVFMNAKGGCGATLLACNVAHVLAARSKKRTALIDLDLQFGAAPLYLDLYPKRGIEQALDNLQGLDEVALDGYFTKHASGLSVLSHSVEESLQAREIAPAAVDQLLDVTLRGYEHVILDLPRSINAVTTTVLQRANHIVLVLQQSVAALRDATRLMQWLRTDAGAGEQQLCVVINRYEKSASVAVADIQKALACDSPLLVPNDFGCVSECINSGTPLLEYAHNSAITRAVMALETRLGGAAAQPGSGLLARTFANLMSGRPR
jgi:pilus assembly protein CpaE